MKRIKLLFATVLTMVVMIVAAAAPALADHVWTEWWQYDDDVWCSFLVSHDDDDEEWIVEEWICYDEETGEVWSSL